jgi:hypothetical protein
MVRLIVLKRRDVDDVYSLLSWRQREDLELFSRFKKWTAALFGRYNLRDQSSANRRLKKLVALGALAVQCGHPLPDGGRSPDVYHLTGLGARLVTRLLGLGSSYVEPPDMSNENDLRHDLTTLEIAVRVNRVHDARAFTKMTIKSAVGEAVTVIPDLMFSDQAFTKRDVYIEVEQTAKAEHFTRKFATYGKISRAYFANAQPAPLLIVIYPSRGIEEMLLTEHQAVAAVVKRGSGIVPLCFASTNLDELRRRQVARLARYAPYSDDEGRPIIEREGLLQCLTHWFDDETQG